MQIIVVVILQDLQERQRGGIDCGCCVVESELGWTLGLIGCSPFHPMIMADIY